MTTHRILSLIDTWQVSGPGRQLAALAPALAPHGLDLMIGCVARRSRGTPPYLTWLRDRKVPAFELPENGPFDPTLPSRAMDLANRVGADLIQTHSYKSTVIGWWHQMLGGSDRPWIAFFHGATAENCKVLLYNRLDGLLLPAADRLVVMSRRDAARFSRSRDRVRVIWNASLPTTDAMPSASPLPVDDLPHPRMLFLGRLSHEKGLDVLLAALRVMGPDMGDCSLMIVGDGPDRAALQVAAELIPRNVRVRFFGHQPSGAAAIAASDLLVLPSRSEGLPNTVLEALAAGLPMVVTAVGALPEVFEGQQVIPLVPVGDYRALGAAVRETLVRQPRTAEVEMAYAPLRDRVSLDRRVASHLALYDELLPSTSR